jgi:hypothetical protein
MTTDAPNSSPSRAGTEPGTGLVALAARLAEALASEPRLRIPLERLWQLHATVDPGATGGQVRRERLAAALQQLASQGKLRPAAASDGRTPPLPRFVTLQRPDRPRWPPPRNVAWHHRLAFLARASAQASPSQLKAFERINQFLKEGGEQRPIVPVQERSIELFDDEKYLNRLLDSALFRHAEWLLGLLRCYQATAPLAYERIASGDGKPDAGALVAENTATFHSLVRALREQAQARRGTGPVGLVVYGEGRHFDAAAPYLGQLQPPHTPVWYFGDLDAKGLATPQLASQRLLAAGLAPVRPAVSLYRLLLTYGRPRPARRPPPPAAVPGLVEWLPPDLRESVGKVLADGNRLAQEAVGYERLCDVDQWLHAKLLG